MVFINVTNHFLIRVIDGDYVSYIIFETHVLFVGDISYVL